jgi:hypothetical protein
MTLLVWLILASLAIGVLAWWWSNRDRSTHAAVESSVLEPAAVDPSLPLHTQPGREFKIAIGSAGIKGIVREGRVEEAYQVRAASETAYEAYADFDKQQEHLALTNRSAGPGFLVLSETLEARSPLSDGPTRQPRGMP